MELLGRRRWHPLSQNRRASAHARWSWWSTLKRFLVFPGSPSGGREVNVSSVGTRSTLRSSGLPLFVDALPASQSPVRSSRRMPKQSSTSASGAVRSLRVHELRRCWPKVFDAVVPLAPGLKVGAVVYTSRRWSCRQALREGTFVLPRILGRLAGLTSWRNFVRHGSDAFGDVLECPSSFALQPLWAIEGSGEEIHWRTKLS